MKYAYDLVSVAGAVVQARAVARARDGTAGDRPRQYVCASLRAGDTMLVVLMLWFLVLIALITMAILFRPRP
jgi:hypothetical protein